MNPKRLTLARERRGMTKKRLAEAAGISVRSIASYERGDQEPQEVSLEVLAAALSFPVEFFKLDDPAEIDSRSASFRSMSRMTAKQRRSALSSAALAVELNRWLEERFSLPLPSIPDLREVGGAGEAAEALRAAWGLGDRPIGNMVHLLESRGARVFSLAEECREVDAFSWWEGDVPFVFLNTKKTSERSRFDAAHELGHLVLHQHGAPNGQEAEAEAQTFASAFLMPYVTFRASAPRYPTMRSIIEVKQRWGVSAMAYARRLRDVGLITDWYYYSNICQKLSAAGFRSGEPGSERRRERSQLLSKVLNHLWSESITKDNIARDLALNVGELDRLIFGLTASGIERDSGGSHSAVPNIRLVSG